MPLKINKYSVRYLKLSVFIIVLTFYLLSPDYFKAQTYYKCKIRLLNSSTQIQGQSGNYLSIRNIELNRGNLKATLINKQKIVASTDTIWGYQIIDNGYIKRVYKGILYNVLQIDNIVLYYQRHYANDFKEYIYYFSLNLDSEIYMINKNNIRKVFLNNECILSKLKSLKVTQFPADWDPKKQTVRLMRWCKECNF